MEDRRNINAGNEACMPPSSCEESKCLPKRKGMTATMFECVFDLQGSLRVSGRWLKRPSNELGLVCCQAPNSSLHAPSATKLPSADQRDLRVGAFPAETTLRLRQSKCTSSTPLKAHGLVWTMSIHVSWTRAFPALSCTTKPGRRGC